MDRRRVVSESVSEEVVITNHDVQARSLTVELEVGSDFAYIFDVKHGRPPGPVEGEFVDGGLVFRHPEGGLTVVVRPSLPAGEYDPAAARLRWAVTVAAGGTWSLGVAVGLWDEQRALWPTRTWTTAESTDQHRAAPWQPPVVACSDPRFAELVDQSADDLASLVVADVDGPRDSFLADDRQVEQALGVEGLGDGCGRGRRRSLAGVVQPRARRSSMRSVPP